MKIFVAEDEELCREDIVSMEWESVGMEVVGSACDGKEALEKIQILKPDIVISDIMMPKYDGIWLANKLNLLMHDIGIIFLTSYNLFDYAKKAIELNISKYILKPISHDQLMNEVKDVESALIEEKKKRITFEDFQKYIHESRIFLKDWFFNMLASGSVQDLDRFGFIATGKKYVSMIVSITYTDDDFNSFNCFQHIHESIFFSRGVENVPFFEKNKYTYIFEFDDSKEEEDIVDKVFSVAGLISNFMKYNDISGYFIGIGRVVTRYSDIKNSYNGAEEALKYRFTLGENQTVYIKEVEPYREGIEIDQEQVKKYMDAIKIASREKAFEVLGYLFSTMRDNNISIDVARQCVYEFCTCLSKSMFDVGQNPMELFRENSVWQKIMDCTMLQDLQELLTEVTESAIRVIGYSRDQKTIMLVETVKKIIHHHYNEKNLSLGEIAGKVYVSPCYLSAIFSREAKMTIKDYITATRIGEAKRLLEQSDYKIYEIADMVGYENSTYFSSTFKKETGQMPTQYRLNVAGNKI
ncbi:MAG: response regulator [Firmicutes bacterium]|nr:response regulator [Bacillota bacterium]